MRTITVMSLVFIALAIAGSEMKSEAQQLPKETVTNRALNHQPEHAPSSVSPGSHEDWCQEHQVPESLCTRCNPSLVAAFKATGDWCAEHGLPESQCRICNTDLKIDRPPRAGGNQP